MKNIYHYQLLKPVGFILFGAGFILRELGRNSSILHVSNILTLAGLIAIVIFAYKSNRLPAYYIILLLLTAIAFLMMPYL